jgi:hypothetical protein
LQILANTIMYYPADSDMAVMAKEMLTFVDEEMQQFLLSDKKGSGD